MTAGMSTDARMDDAQDSRAARAISFCLRYTSGVSKAVALAGGACIAVTAGLIVYGVVARNLLSRPVGGLEEIAGFLTLPAVFLPLAYTLQTGGHIRTELLIGRLGPRSRQAAELATRLLALLFTTLLAYALIRRTGSLYTTGSRSAGGAILLWIPGLTMVFGTGLLWVRLAIEILAGLTGTPIAEITESGDLRADVPRVHDPLSTDSADEEERHAGPN